MTQSCSSSESRHRILVVEDDPPNRELILRVLRTIGYRCEAACNGEEALQVLRSHPFDLVLMDISMPVMDGRTATRELRRFPEAHPNRDVPVIAITAHARQEMAPEFYADGINAIVNKPFTIPLLRDALYAQLGKAG